MRVRKYLYKILIVMLVLSSYSCEEYLDAVPENEITKDRVFTNYESVNKVLGVTYWSVHNYIAGRDDWSGPVGVYSDECQPVHANGPHSTNAHTGNWLDWTWREMGFQYNDGGGGQLRRKGVTVGGLAVVGIRLANIALDEYETIREIEEVPQLPGGITGDQIKDYMEGEFRLLRAWFHFELIRRYGPLVIIDVPMDPNEPFLAERERYDVMTDWIVSELETAANLLPEKWTGDFEGRATKTSAMAIRSMALLYAASPNMNLLDNGVEAYNDEYLQRAAEASLEAIQTAQNSGYYRMYPWSEYMENWWSDNDFISDEALWGPPQEYWDNQGNANVVGAGMFRPRAIPGAGGWAAHAAPTQNAVDKFEHIYDNGNAAKAIEDSPEYDPQNPYEDRDPRFYEFIWKNGDDYFFNNDTKVEAWVGGPQWNNANQQGRWTGYFTRKHLWKGCNNVDNVGKQRRMPHIRFVQLYLDFAEAANELVGPNGAISHAGMTMTAVEAINVVRNRVGMPDIHADYTVNADVFRERIRNERAVELYQEMHRFQDLRRWRAFDELQHIYYAVITKDGDNFTYDKAEIENARQYTDKHYWYPLPQAEVQNNPNLAQSPGW
ncbi:RagB/SusD family nutrient uptake outer membrane protein [Marinoscillum furvescens]|uniref:Putative outer membrane starch-binding protein n=1 Tax=Marinoscillum furvescens DSM 4134 TaxID=1122208 RepID=A0A3D9L1I9_MARFU|nr:RagB/SusD family nutrient uptake outer membrane protein [Marinoscillum furvescens]RED96013.1 putative outer membrane starch-binding protein [Marinoscillum furvescens DSM 4134]